MEPDMNTDEGVRVRHGWEEGASNMGARRISGMEARRARARRDGWARRSARPPRRSERGRWAGTEERRGWPMRGGEEKGQWRAGPVGGDQAGERKPWARSKACSKFFQT